MKCACGFENSADARFCIGCGREVPAVGASATTIRPPSIRCSCGLENALDAKFCTGCGMAITSVAPPEGADRIAPAVQLPAPTRVPAKNAAVPGPHPEIKAPRRRKASTRIFLFALAGALVIGGAAFGWLNRPGSAQKLQDIGVYPFWENGKFGLVDAKANVVVQPVWDAVAPGRVSGRPVYFSEGLLPVRSGGKWGYADAHGQMVIQPQFDDAGPFTEELAAVALGNGQALVYGYINRRGEYVINPQFQRAGNFQEGLAPVASGGEWGAVDRKGTFVIRPGFAHVGPLSDGLILVQTREGLWGYLDRNGKMAISPQFMNGTEDFSEGLAPVNLLFRHGYIDRTGKFVIQPQFDSATSFRNGLAVVSVAGKTATIRKDGKFVLNPGQITGRAIPGCDLLEVQANGGTGLMTRDGKWAVEPSPLIANPNFVCGQTFLCGFSPLEHVGDGPIVAFSGKILSGKFRGLTLDLAAQRIAKEQEELQLKEAQAKAEQAGVLFQQGQYRPALVLCEESLRLQPANEQAAKLKSQIEQTISILEGK